MQRIILRRIIIGGTWMAQSLEHLTQLMISGLRDRAPKFGSMLSALGLLDILSLPLPLHPPPHTFSVSLFLKKKKGGGWLFSN